LSSPHYYNSTSTAAEGVDFFVDECRNLNSAWMEAASRFSHSMDTSALGSEHLLKNSSSVVANKRLSYLETEALLASVQESLERRLRASQQYNSEEEISKVLGAGLLSRRATPLYFPSQAPRVISDSMTQPAKTRKRSSPNQISEDASSGDESTLATSRKKHSSSPSPEVPLIGGPFPSSICGETRLNIKFTSMGEPGPVPQKFGKHSCGIPDKLSGTHQMYDQRWRFEVTHLPQNGSTVLIRWTVTNLTSGTVTVVTETSQDAMVRETCGRTICNTVLKTALEIRAVELENSLATSMENPAKLVNVQDLIKALRPKRCTVGLLFFGLLHESVQKNLEQMLNAGESPACVADEAFLQFPQTSGS